MTKFGWRLMAAAIAATMAAEGTAGAVVLCKKKNGAAFVRDACKKKETQVPAADLGLVGPPGANGTNGTNGAPGAVGPSHTHQIVGTDGAVGTSSATVATLSLPAGKYLIMGRTWVTNNAGDVIECDLVASADGSETGTFSKDSMKVGSGTIDDTPAMTTLVHEFTSPGVVKAHCKAQFDGGTAHRPTITAIEVGAIN